MYTFTKEKKGTGIFEKKINHFIKYINISA